jgi:N-acyl-D-aspartate/D-glutamate deacylase
MAGGQREPLGWGYYAKFFDDIAMSAGRAYGQVAVREQTLLYGFRVGLPFDRLPGWKQFRSEPLEVQRRILEQADRREALVAEALRSEYRAAVAAEPRPPIYDHIFIVDSPEGPWQSVADEARRRNTTPVDVIIDISLESNFEQLFGDKYANRDWETLHEMLSHPWTVIGDGDAGAHASQMSDASFFTSFLSEWVRRRQTFTIQEGVRMCSFDQARLWGFNDRGLIRQGLAGDLVVFDLEKIGPGTWYVDDEQPAGAKRIMQKATGIEATVVNGVVVTEHGKHTGAAPGEVLRGPLASR